MAQTRYVLNQEKIKLILVDQGRTQEWLSVVAGFGATWISDHFRRGRGVTQEQADKIALILNVSLEDILLYQNPKTEMGGAAPKTNDYSKELSDMYLMLKKLLVATDKILENQEAAYNKLNTLVTQNCRLQDALRDIKAPSKLDIVKQFLRNELGGGRMKVSTIKEDASDLGISQKELMAAKKELDIKAEVGGYGTNKETYWYI